MTATNKPKYSLCIPYAGGEKYLRLALMSLRKIPMADIEVIVSQDVKASPNLIGEVCKWLNVTWLDGPKKGMASNWNHCIKNASGDFIIFLHADDELAPGYFSLIEELQKSEPDSSAWYCGVSIINESGEEITTAADSVKKLITPNRQPLNLQGDKGLSLLLRGCFIYCPTVCFRATVLRSYEFDNTKKMVADLDLYARMLVDGLKISGTNEVGYLYRRHSANTSLLLTRKVIRFSEELALYDDLKYSLPRSMWRRSRCQAGLKIMPKLHILFELTMSLARFEVRRCVALYRLLGRGSMLNRSQ